MLLSQLSKKWDWERVTEEANRHVKIALNSTGTSQKRKATKHSEETRAKYAAENGAAAAMRHFKHEMADLPESTVRKYKNLYITELSTRTKNNFSENTAFTVKKRGRPLSLGEALDGDVQRSLSHLTHQII